MGKRGPKPVPLEVRFHKHYAIDPVTGCWEWTGCKSVGYGRIGAPSIAGVKQAPLLAHRVAYELMVGPIPEGLVIDHLCRNRGCVNPEHLRVCTAKENTLAGAAPNIMRYWLNTCIRGHDLNDPANVYVRRDTGHRQCRLCIRIRERGRRRPPAKA